MARVEGPGQRVRRGFGGCGVPRGKRAGAASAEEAAQAHSEIMNLALNTGIDAGEVADLVVQGIKTGQFYLFPHPELKAATEARTEEILGSVGEADPARVAMQEEFLAALLPGLED